MCELNLVSDALMVAAEATVVAEVVVIAEVVEVVEVAGLRGCGVAGLRCRVRGGTTVAN